MSEARSGNEELTIEVVCRHLPGIRFDDSHNPAGVVYEPVHLGIQKGNEVTGAVPGNRKTVIFRPAFKIGKQPDGSPNFLGPFAKGKPSERFFYLSWGVVDNAGHFAMFRRAKIHLNHLSWEPIRDAISSNRPIRVIIDMTDKKGGPLCASVRRDRADWQI
ncbi:MAG TPA: DUF5990 family protein [Blastocatellia bacterium]|nr:DUF5990 family protein [Blastocatellia bacterium]